jgi:hypothetical protein
MEKFIPFEKLSKREKREMVRLRRGDWGALNPVTRKAKNPKAYDRNKARKWNDDSSKSELSFCAFAPRVPIVNCQLSTVNCAVTAPFVRSVIRFGN